MNAAQLKTIRYLTNRVHAANCMLNGETLNGPINWRIEPCPFGSLNSKEVMLVGSNVEGARWFDKNLFFLAFIGPRGGVTVRHHINVPAYAYR